MRAALWALIGALPLAAGAAAGPGAKAKRAPEGPAAPRFENYRLKEGYFACKVPAGWQVWRDEADDAADKVYGIVLKGPKAEGVPARITVYYYAEGNGSFATPDEYVAAQTGDSPLGPDGLERGAVKGFDLNGLRARRFRRVSVEFVPPDSASARKVKLRAEKTVVEPGKGFFVIAIEAPESAFERFLPLYERLLASFRPFP